MQVFFFFSFVVLCGCTESSGAGGDDRRMGGQEDSVASDVGDSTFAVFLQGDFYIGGGDVAFLSALLPRPCPAVAFILLDDVQHLQWWRCQNNTMTFFWWLASLVRHYG